jgi:hypothetical protein
VPTKNRLDVVKPVYAWRILCFKSVPVRLLGTVAASDERAAVEIAIHRFEITDPETRKWLLAVRRVEISG